MYVCMYVCIRTARLIRGNMQIADMRALKPATRSLVYCHAQSLLMRLGAGAQGHSQAARADADSVVPKSLGYAVMVTPKPEPV